MKKIRILIVDDNELNRWSLELFLSTNAMLEVVADCSDGDEVLASLNLNQIDVVVMDFNMSRVNGDEATKLVKMYYPHIIVIGYSFDPDNMLIRKMLEAGAIEVLNKASNISTLKDSIVANYYLNCKKLKSLC